MPSPHSITSLPIVGFSFLSMFATWALVEAVGEGEQMRFVTDNVVLAVAVYGVLIASVRFFLGTWFAPSEYASGVVLTYRVLRAMISTGMFATIFGMVGVFAVIWITSENTTSVAVLFFCVSLVTYGFWFGFLTVVAGGIIGIAIDLIVVASRIRIPKARCR